MKNIQLIEPAENCVYALYSCSDEHFNVFFPLENQDVEFAEEVCARVSQQKADEIFGALYGSPIDKKEAVGIHGTLFLQLGLRKKHYPNKSEQDIEEWHLLLAMRKKSTP